MKNGLLDSIGHVLLFVGAPFLAYIADIAAIREHHPLLFASTPVLACMAAYGFVKARQTKGDKDFVTWVLFVGASVIVWQELVALGGEPGWTAFTFRPYDSDQVKDGIQQLQTWTLLLCIVLAIYGSYLLARDGYRLPRRSYFSDAYMSAREKDGIPAVKNTKTLNRRSRGE